jgi:aldehyde:ferredoxin oxidoreductase
LTNILKDGHYLTKQPEYETVWAHGGNCGICDLDDIAQLDFLDDNGVTELGKQFLKTERDFNARAGFTAEHDRLPRFFKTEPVAPHNVTFDVKDEDLDKVFNW